MPEYALGLVSLEIADIPTDGTMAADIDFETVGDSVKGTVLMTQEDGTNTDFNIEEQDDPILTIQTQRGKKILNFSCYNVDATTLERFFGGVITPGPPIVYTAPESDPELEKALKLTGKRGHIFRIPRAKIVAKLNWAFTSDKLAQIDLVATILIPTDDATKPFNITYPEATS